MTLSPYTVTIITKSDNPFNVIPNAPIEIRVRLANGTSGSLVSIFSDSAGTVPITQTGATADSDGQFTFFAEAAEYNAVFNNGVTVVTRHIDTGVTIAVLNDRIDRLNPATLAIWQDDTSAQDGDVINPLERTSGDGGGATWEVKTGLTANGSNIVDHNTLALQAKLVDDQHLMTFEAQGADSNDPDTSLYRLALINEATNRIKLAQRPLFNVSSNQGVVVENISIPPSDNRILINKESANIISVYTPLGPKDEYAFHRMSNDESLFDEPVASGGVRPWLKTQIFRAIVDLVGATDSRSYILHDGRQNGVWTVSGNYEFVDAAEGYVKFSFSGRNLDLKYGAFNNSGIAHVEIDGRADLCDAITPVGGNAEIDMFGPSGLTILVRIANNLEPGLHQVTVRWTGTKNGSSTGTRIYMRTDESFITQNFTIDSVALATVTVIDNFDNGGSAVSYAYACRPNSEPSATTGFIGDVHGSESLDDIKFIVDDAEVDLIALSVGEWIVADRLAFRQETTIEHPQSLGTTLATNVITHSFSENGIDIRHSWTLAVDTFFTNGYSTMWTVFGGAVGANPADPNGWCNRVYFGGNGQETLVLADDTEVGHVRSGEIILWGTDKAPSGEANRSDDSGKYACVCRVPDIEFMFGKDNTKFALSQHQKVMWVQDRATRKKLYGQNLNLNDFLPAATTINGGISAKFVVYDKMSSFVSTF